MKAKKRLIEICILLLVMLFLYTVSIKVLEHDKFIFQLRDSPLRLISFFAPVLAFVVPSFSAAIVVLLLLPGWSRVGLWAALVLLFMFELYIIVVLVSGLRLPCNCSGLHNELSWYGHLGVNAGFMFIGTVALLGLYNRWPLRARACPIPSSRGKRSDERPLELCLNKRSLPAARDDGAGHAQD
ncbi:MauE/DoxX family redox-associated membrane protein [Pedobacter heparinus]|uniref:MauE/DoxX family redox-associated membrane protein n=1 Tax=Pedobacter heparinus TaxID=984 RepID=UPI00292CFE90|nr:MauE/DoxX family redox-associated membrane protein [Pedobacter heparinus]